MDEIPFVDDRSDVRSIATSRKAAEDYQKHENEWKLYLMVSGIKSTPRTSFSPASPANTFLPRPLSTPGSSTMHSTPSIPSSVSREEQRILEREKRRQQRVHAETENILQSGYDFSGLSAPCRQTQLNSDSHEKTLDAVHKNSQILPTTSLSSSSSSSPSSLSSVKRPFLPPSSSSLIREVNPRSSYQSLSSPSHSVFDEDNNDDDAQSNGVVFQEVSKEIESSSLTPDNPQRRLIPDKPTLPKLPTSQFKKRPLPSSSSKKTPASTSSTSSASSASQNFLKRLRV